MDRVAELSNRKRFAILSPNPDFSTNPSLMAVLEELTACGHAVDIYMRSNKNHPPIAAAQNIYPFPLYFYKTWNWLGIWRNIRQIAKGGIKGRQILQKNSYDLVFGVDSDGVIGAHQFFLKSKTPFVYLSYEIFFRDELTKRIDKIEKQLEIEASRAAALIVIQDSLRESLLKKENGLSQQKVLHLPVAPRADKKLLKKSSFLRDRYNIPDDQWIVLQSGSLSGWSCTRDLINSFSCWPENITLVLHTKSKKTAHFVRGTEKKSGGGRIIISTDPLDSKNYEELVASADIGLALYKPSVKNRYFNKNIINIGLSSGKLSMYTKFGLPIICSVGQINFDLFYNEYEFAINMHTVAEIKKALEKIISDYPHMKQESERFFEEKLAFENYWPDILKKIHEIAA